MAEIDSEEPQEILVFGAGHRLFVEGSGNAPLDQEVMYFYLQKIKGSAIEVRTLGGSESVKSAATALHTHHDNYYFLIDRDDFRSDNEVEESWRNFPDASKSNLLIWRKRELENYFIDPSFLAKSSYKVCTDAELETKLIQIAQKRIYLDIVNSVVTRLRMLCTNNCALNHFNESDITTFPTLQDAEAKLLGRWDEKEKNQQKISRTQIKELLKSYQTEFWGKSATLAIGQGRWLEMLSGKEVLNELMRGNKFFKVQSRSGTLVQGSDKVLEVIKDLLRQEEPQDFKELYNLLDRQIKKVS